MLWGGPLLNEDGRLCSKKKIKPLFYFPFFYTRILVEERDPPRYLGVPPWFTSQGAQAQRQYRLCQVPIKVDSGCSLGADVDKQTPDNPCWGGREVVGSRTTPELEIGWDLGLGILHFSACPWTNISFSNKIQRNYKGLKITACMCRWEKVWTVRLKKTQKAQLPLLKSPEQKQGVRSKSRALPMPHAHNTT